MTSHRMTPDKRRRLDYALTLLQREPLGNGGIAPERFEYVARVAQVEVGDLRRAVQP